MIGPLCTAMHASLCDDRPLAAPIVPLNWGPSPLQRLYATLTFFDKVVRGFGVPARLFRGESDANDQGGEIVGEAREDPERGV